MKYALISIAALAANALFLHLDTVIVFILLFAYIAIDKLEQIESTQDEILRMITPQEYPDDTLV